MTRRHRFQPFPPRAAWCRWLGGGLCALALLAAANGAYAQRSGRAQTEAGKLADRGYDLMQRGEHAAAATLFLRADERFHSPVFLVFAAQAEEKQQHLLAARRLLKRVATERLSPNATAAFRNARSKAQKQLPALDKRIPRVVVSARGYRGRVTVELDGRSLDDRLGTAVRVDPGRHQLIAATKTGTERQRFTVAEGERKSIALVFVEKDDVAAPMVPEPADPDEGSGDGTRVAGIVALSVGAGAAIVWGATGLSFIAATDDLKQACEGYRDDPN
ncbi:MAG TPA: hypothetical protein ENK23_00265, partial [Sorangium sp.]|nr:hypothetical protein [Sorangium sp.]